MTKLYYTCSTASDSSFSAAFSGEVRDLECEQVDLSQHTTSSGEDYFQINPRRNVPCLVLNDGTVLNDRREILHFISEHQVRAIIISPPTH